MAKFDEADARLLKNIFVCRKCKSKVRAPMRKVLLLRVNCRKCGSKALRPARKK